MSLYQFQRNTGDSEYTFDDLFSEKSWDEDSIPTSPIPEFNFKGKDAYDEFYWVVKSIDWTLEKKNSLFAEYA